MRRCLGVMGFAAVAALLASVPAAAQEQTVVEIPVDTVVRGEPGSEHEVTTEPVDPQDAGQSCTVVAEGANNMSVHPTTDLIVRSGESEVVAPDVEREPNVSTAAQGTITLSDEITVAVRLGPDGVFSAGLVVNATCEPPPTTTESTTTTEAPMTSIVPQAGTPDQAPTTSIVPQAGTPDQAPTTSIVPQAGTPEPPATTTTLDVVRTLPKTGGDSDGLLVAAGIFLLVGGAALAGRTALRRRGHA